MEPRHGLLAGFLAVVIGAAAFAGRYSGGEWYLYLPKPAWTPPAWVFGLGWATTWLVLGLAAWRIWREGRPGALTAGAAWLLQVVLMCAWSWLLFGLHRPGWSAAAGVLLVAASGLTIRLFGRIDRAAAILLVPAFAWLAFIWLQNLAWWRLSGGGWSTILG